MLGPFHRILVPVDFSPRSEASLAYALRLATETGGSIDVLHCLDPIHDLPGMLAYQSCETSNILSEIRKRLDAMLARHLSVIGMSLAESPINSVTIREGKLPQLIARMVGELKSQLLVVGGGGGTSDLETPSTARNLIDTVSCPVLIIPPATTYRVPRTLALAGPASVMALEQVRELMQALSAPHPLVRCIHICTQEAPSCLREFAHLEERFEWGDYPFEMSFHELKANSVVEGLLSFVQESQPDFLILNRPERRGFEEWKRTSYARSLAICTPLPLLVITDTKRGHSKAKQQADRVISASEGRDNAIPRWFDGVVNYLANSVLSRPVH